MAKSSRSADSMEIGFRKSWKVEVDDHIHGLDIDTSGENVSANEASGFTILKIMINSASVILLHL